MSAIQDSSQAVGLPIDTQPPQASGLEGNVDRVARNSISPAPAVESDEFRDSGFNSGLQDNDYELLPPAELRHTIENPYDSVLTRAAVNKAGLHDYELQPPAALASDTQEYYVSVLDDNDYELQPPPGLKDHSPIYENCNEFPSTDAAKSAKKRRRSTLTDVAKNIKNAVLRKLRPQSHTAAAAAAPTISMRDRPLPPLPNYDHLNKQPINPYERLANAPSTPATPHIYDTLNRSPTHLRQNALYEESEQAAAPASTLRANLLYEATDIS